MKKFIVLLIVITGLVVLSAPQVNAQMMGYPSQSPNSINSSNIQSQQQEEQEGKALLDKLSNKQITCSQITDSDFEKVGEYFMGQYINNTTRHIQMNENIKSMMGEQGEEQMHTALGKQKSGCEVTAAYPNMMKGGVPTMMGLGYGNMMGGYGFGLIATLFWIVSFVDLVLLGIWLWKQIQKK